MASQSDTTLDKSSILTAVYQSPRTSQDTAAPPAHVFAQQLSASVSPSGEHSPAKRTAYLAELRGSIISLQADVNAFLTEKMEDDKRREAQESGGVAAADEKKEEDNYGEEVVNDEDE
ncbi:uncharacterized protein GIQ15_02021 [Arthroderma uncinatum]|uniref:uncharacterized protein n=1 Tax=Arthroderma uncinatum TaxID=74035 RepID=UPI00144AC8BB|nr:uncharacterized protein GIQ15_02021 [Arthroderma uncinatum]KAF3482697.1 hypothetical protein GIQ15_02021 [Arthroderma uncinatum]